MGSIEVEKEYEKNPNLKKDDILELKEWTKEQKTLPDIPEKLLILFYHASGYNMNKAQNYIKVYFEVRSSTPEFFSNRDMSLESLQKVAKVTHCAVMPVKDPNGNLVMYNGLQDPDPSKYEYAPSIKVYHMLIDSVLDKEGTLPGVVFLCSMKNMKMGHMFKSPLKLARKYFRYIQEGLPVNIKAFHVVDTLPIMEKVMFIIKPFMKKETLELMHLHSSNYEELYPYLPKECLPKDFGGDLPTLDELHNKCCSDLEKLTPWFLESEKLYTKQTESNVTNLRTLDVD